MSPAAARYTNAATHKHQLREREWSKKERIGQAQKRMETKNGAPKVTLPEPPWEKKE